MQQIPYHRQKQADEAYQQALDMTTNQYIWDTILAYLQSGAFMFLWFGTLFAVLGYLVWKRVQGK